MVALPVETLMYLCEFVWQCRQCGRSVIPSILSIFDDSSLFSSLSSFSHLLKDSDMCPSPTKVTLFPPFSNLKSRPIRRDVKIVAMFCVPFRYVRIDLPRGQPQFSSY